MRDTAQWKNLKIYNVSWLHFDPCIYKRKFLDEDNYNKSGIQAPGPSIENIPNSIFQTGITFKSYDNRPTFWYSV